MRSTLTIGAVLAAGAALASAAFAQLPPSGAAPLDPAQVARGDALYSQRSCVACHGVLGTGGTNNAPDLNRSSIAQANDGGRTLQAFLQTGRPELGMPPSPITLAQAADLSAKLHALALAQAPAPAAPGAAARAALPAALAGQDLSIVVGDPKYGRAFFDGPVGKCSTCHAVQDGQASPAANLAHVAAKFKSEKELQNNMLVPGRDQAWSPRSDKNVRATAVYADGRRVAGYLNSVSDFKLVIRDEAGAVTTIPRAKGEPKVELTDRLQAHLDLLTVYQDNDIHNLTAYLATLK